MPNRPVLAPAACLLALALSGCAQPAPPVPAAPPVGIDLGSAPGRAQSPLPPMAVATTTPSGNVDHGAHHPAAAAGAIPGHGTIEAIDPARRRVTVAHEPMPKIGWPAMTMVFPAPSSVDLTAFHPGDHVDFSLVKNPDGTYRLQSLQPIHH